MLLDMSPQLSRNLTGTRHPHTLNMKTKPDMEILKLKVQETLDELLTERRIPFALTAQRIKREDVGKYEVPFYDSRLHSIRSSLEVGSSLKQVVRAAVLDRIKKMSGPLSDWTATVH
jgi:hypothetical protein